MSIFEGILLGVLQGIAEFLPISSSGHLKLVQSLLSLNDVPLLFDVFLHLATLCAVVLYFRKKIWALLCVLGRLISRRPAPTQIKNADGSVTLLTQKQANERELVGRRYILAAILSTLVTGVLGILSEKLIKDISIKYVCVGFLFTACLLVASSIIARRRPSSEGGYSSPSWWQALLIGVAQGVGTLPGVSRSGSTIAGALFCGVDRATAGEYSFIVSIPAILGAFILELKDLGDMASTVGAAPVAAGCAAAFATGYLSLVWLMRLIRKGKLEWFACYLVPLGILGLIFLH